MTKKVDHIQEVEKLVKKYKSDLAWNVDSTFYMFMIPVLEDYIKSAPNIIQCGVIAMPNWAVRVYNDFYTNQESASKLKTFIAKRLIAYYTNKTMTQLYAALETLRDMQLHTEDDEKWFKKHGLDTFDIGKYRRVYKKVKKQNRKNLYWLMDHLPELWY